MTVQCLTCKHFTLRDSPLAKQGFGKCAVGKAYQFMSAVYEKVCQRHVELDAAEVEKRRQWWEGRK